jgi:dipeptidyl aminopeptidase/acylaminoacyl peptidase
VGNFPPNFDATKNIQHFILPRRTTKRLTQFYSFRWNFQLMAANGYIVVAPNRRGMPGQWNGMSKSVKTGADSNGRLSFSY